jgi:hypothetical protein
MKGQTMRLLVPATSSWKPKRRSTAGQNGDIYCSPACGGDCTLKDYREKKRISREVAQLLSPGGKGWKPVVWENLGWHCKVVSPHGHVEVYIYPEDNTYMVSLASGQEELLLDSAWIASDSAPIAAVKKFMSQCEKAIKRLESIVAEPMRQSSMPNKIPSLT